jgi:SAM-dependent methyltransferase
LQGKIFHQLLLEKIGLKVLSDLDQSYEQFVLNYVSLPWENNDDDPRDDIRGKNSFVVSYERFRRVLHALSELRETGPLISFVDVGPFPGNVYFLLRTYFNDPENLRYFGIGLGFSDEYRKFFAELGAQTIETEIDPEFVAAKDVRNWNLENNDCCLLLDVIEHLTNPIFALESINKSLRMGGSLVLTTDNIAAIGYIIPMIKSGRSPNGHPLKTSLFYRGNWRPHAREFSQEELRFFLTITGFTVTSHDYFERRQGDFYIDLTRQRINKKKRLRGVKRLIIATVLKMLPHLRDHQIIIAKKTKELSEIGDDRPMASDDVKEWVRMRHSFGQG